MNWEMKMPKSQPKSNKITKTSEDKEKVLTIVEPIEFIPSIRVKHVSNDYHRPDLLSIKEQSGYKSFKRMERERRLKESKKRSLKNQKMIVLNRSFIRDQMEE